MAHHSPPRNNGLTRRNGQLAPPQATFFTKQTFMVLGVGILFGYVLLPVLMIEMNVEEALQALPTVEVKYPGSINTPSGPHLRPMSDAAPPRNLELAASSNGLKLSDAEQRLVEAHDIYSSQSMPTYSTPYVMKTPKLPDHQRKKILVTGGAGFVGSHLVDKLMMEGHEVTVIDNFFTGQKKNVAHWFHHPNFRYVCVFLFLSVLCMVDNYRLYLERH
jgi:NAD dependent epimerase/dehydratase family